MRGSEEAELIMPAPIFRRFWAREIASHIRPGPKPRYAPPDAAQIDAVYAVMEVFDVSEIEARARALDLGLLRETGRA